MENNNVGVGEDDKISNLPPDLIHRILSFLPIECAMSTCILSKRWNYVARSIPILDFSNWRAQKVTKKEEKLETKSFMNFLDTLLFLHEKPNYIQEFYLVLDQFFDEPRVYRWIKTIMKRKVVKLGLSITSLSTSILPLSFFTCDSLALLDLDFDMTNGGKFNIPNTVSFPNLKILRLGSLCFLDETSTRKLFSNCPILKELSLDCCTIPEGLCISNPTLEHLFISDCFYKGNPPLKSNVIEISAPNLLTIQYEGKPPGDFFLSSFLSLVEADVHFDSNEEHADPKKILVQLFEKLSSAKLLNVCICAGSFLQVLSEADILLTDLPTYNNLINLEVGSSLCCTRSSFGSNSVGVMRCFFRFLPLAPNLESIVFTQSIYIPEEECWSLDPKFSLRHLKSIKVQSFMGNQMELNAIKLCLKHARFLETVTIVASRKLSKDHRKQLDVTKLLLMYPKPADCVVKFLTCSEDA